MIPTDYFIVTRFVANQVNCLDLFTVILGPYALFLTVVGSSFIHSYAQICLICYASFNLNKLLSAC